MSMENRTFRIILAVVLIIVSLILVTLALILYSRHSIVTLWLVPIAAFCPFLLGSVTLVSTLRNNKKSLPSKNGIPPQQ